MALVEIDELDVAFAGRPAVSSLSLQIERGERFGIIGESGSGKSLTALAITGLLPENAEVEGSIRFDGAPLPQDEKALARLRGKRIGMVFQEPMTALNPLMRIGQQVSEAITLAGRDETPDETIDLLGEVGLEPVHAQRFPHEMSGGQRQRAMIAMALASQPELMIADEPTSALDAITQRRVLELISEVCTRRQMTLIFISHDIRAVAMLCTRIAVMRAGVVVESGATEAVLRAPVSDYTRRLLAASRIERAERPQEKKREVLLEADKVSRVFHQSAWPFRRAAPVVAVDQVSFALGKGEVVALAGPSGCGKTTLARMIVGLDTATSGSFRLDRQSYRGRDLPPLLRAGVSLVFQDPFSSFDPRMTIGRSLAEPLGLIGTPSRADCDRKLDDAVRSVGLEPSMLERYPHEFSGGQRQRLAIARALITNPRLLVLDEPVSALDVSVRGEVLALLGRLREEHGLSYLVISHDLDMVAALADRVLVMDHGRIVEAGPPDTLFSQARHEMTRALVDARLPEAV